MFSKGQSQQILEVTRFPKKRDFLTRPSEESKKNQLTRETLATSQCTINVLPARYSFFAACIPSVVHKVETAVLATHLQNTLLKPVGIKNLQLIIEATTSGAADFTASYERLEYLGDAVLKYCTHVQLAAQHPEWPESYLTAEKGRTNGNASLSRTALRSGVDKFISTTKFTGNHRKPPILSTSQTQKDKVVDRSTKTLADIVEALIGASYIDQGLPRALSCIRIFLPKEQWLSHAECLSTLLSQSPSLSSTPLFLSTVESLIGYKFSNPGLLLEALTHSSFSSNDALSYERLEFLGDAILDQLLVPAIFSAAEPVLKNHEMHRVRQALANAHILGICCLELSLPVPRLEPRVTETGEVGLEESPHVYHLHSFLRCGPSVQKQRQVVLDRYIPLRTSILEQLDSSHEYPWPDLLRLSLHKSKYLSDILESVLGAIYIDSSGNLSTCACFISKLGLLTLLNRFLDEGVQVGFSKERLGLMANEKGVEYVTYCDGQGGEWRCKIFVGKREIVEVERCVSREEAEVSGAATAVRVLQEEIVKGMEKVALSEDQEMVDGE
jgi:dsRNA-specific ribonuclease